MTQPAQQAPVQLRFGPVYPSESATDGVVVAALRSVDTTGTEVVAAEIRGYVADWVLAEGDVTRVQELVIMKDGSLHRFTNVSKPLSFWGPPATRLTPESEQEAALRNAAVSQAQDAVVWENDVFRSVKPNVYAYIVRLHHQDGSTTDAYVDPDVGPGSGIWYDPPVVPFAK